MLRYYFPCNFLRCSQDTNRTLSEGLSDATNTYIKTVREKDDQINVLKNELQKYANLEKERKRPLSKDLASDQDYKWSWSKLSETFSPWSK